MSSTSLLFGAPEGQFTPKHTIFIGPRDLLGHQSVKAGIADIVPESVRAIAAVVEDGREKSAKAWDGEKSFTFAELDTRTSRNLGTVRADLIQQLVQKHVPSKEDVQLNVLLSDQNQVVAAASAISRSFPKFSRKSAAKDAAPRTVLVKFLTPSSGELSETVYGELNVLAGAVRHAAHLVDSPTSELDTTALVGEVEAVAARHSGTVKKTIISGEALREHGLNAIYGVGKAARAPPALAVLEYTPSRPAKGETKLALVGKGIVYDTGGLSLKTTAGMCEMKTDCGGAIALLTAFDALVRLETPFPIVYVGCIAENALGSGSQRNDDIVVAFSGKSIELNNTDAEGRLVLADGVAYSTLNHKPTHLIDMATLTGAQMIATGMNHAGVVSRTKEFEDTVYAAGQRSGDWCFPMLYAPEILEKEFESKVADMKNSVKNRANAQSSCAGHFVESHLNEEWKGEWAHVDIAGPSFREGRATGFGVALVLDIAKELARGA